jgi:hypothetical protein
MTQSALQICLPKAQTSASATHASLPVLTIASWIKHYPVNVGQSPAFAVESAKDGADVRLEAGK